MTKINEAPEKHPISEVISSYRKENNTDILFYSGEIGGDIDDLLINECRQKKLEKNCLFILRTRGGDPNVAYRITRCIQQAYKTTKKLKKEGIFTMFVDLYCQSAGTLICLGADRVLMTGNGYFSPLDTQILSKNEYGDTRSESSLIPLKSLEYVTDFSRSAFFQNYIYLKHVLGLSSEKACSNSTNLTVGLFEPLMNQIDTQRLAEVNRSLEIASNYARRVENGNLKEGAIDRLSTKYPSHGFIIDREESKEILHNVNPPDDSIKEIANYCHEAVGNCEKITFVESE